MSDRNAKQTRDEDDDDDKSLPAKPLPPPVGFFAIYKKGQGYWTRLATAFAALGLLVMVSHWIYGQTRSRLAEALVSDARARDAAGTLARNISLGIAAGIVLIGAIIVWRIMNSPRGAEFLITTDSEMKKVNWSTREEIVGSTKVVVIFLVLIGLFLFFSDIIFGYFFHLIGVLRTSPFA